jgi:hypothetical protein
VDPHSVGSLCPESQPPRTKHFQSRPHRDGKNSSCRTARTKGLRSKAWVVGRWPAAFNCAPCTSQFTNARASDQLAAMVLSMIVALNAAPALLGTQEAIRQGQAKEKREEHRARRCNLIATCVQSSKRSSEIDGRRVVLLNNKVNPAAKLMMNLLLNHTSYTSILEPKTTLYLVIPSPVTIYPTPTPTTRVLYRP